MTEADQREIVSKLLYDYQVNWRETITQVLRDSGREEMSLQEIYREMKKNPIVKSGHLLPWKPGGQPKYQCWIRRYLTDLVDEDVVERKRKGVYSLKGGFTVKKKGYELREVEGEITEAGIAFFPVVSSVLVLLLEIEPRPGDPHTAPKGPRRHVFLLEKGVAKGLAERLLEACALNSN